MLHFLIHTALVPLATIFMLSTLNYVGSFVKICMFNAYLPLGYVLKFLVLMIIMSSSVLYLESIKLGLGISIAIVFCLYFAMKIHNFITPKWNLIIVNFGVMVFLGFFNFASWYKILAQILWLFLVSRNILDLTYHTFCYWIENKEKPAYLMTLADCMKSIERMRLGIELTGEGNTYHDTYTCDEKKVLVTIVYILINLFNSPILWVWSSCLLYVLFY